MIKPICEKCGNDGTRDGLFLTLDARWNPGLGVWDLLEPMPDARPSGWDCTACDHVTPREGRAAMFPYGAQLTARPESDMSEPVKIAVILEGGVVQSILSAGVAVDVVTVDYDTEGETLDPARGLVSVPQDGGGMALAWVGAQPAARTPHDMAFTARLFEIAQGL